MSERLYKSELQNQARLNLQLGSKSILNNPDLKGGEGCHNQIFALQFITGAKLVMKK